MNTGSRKKMTLQEALEKAERYCAFQERCTDDVYKKLLQWGLDAHDREKIIAQLRDENFLSDSRFAALYVRSKINQKRWGRIRIKMELARRHIDGGIINEALQKVDEDRYRENLQVLAQKKAGGLSEEDPEKREWKLRQYLYSKGYEADWIDEIIKKIN